MPMNLYLQKIINGGEDGAEQGALGAAFLMNCPTGGCSPKGYKTSKGLKPDLKFLNLLENHSDSLKAALDENIKDSNGTLIFVRNPEDLNDRYNFIMEQCNQYHKPFMQVPLNRFLRPEALVSFIKKHKIKVLHVTGNIEEDKSKKMFSGTKDLIERFIKEVVKESKNDETAEIFDTSGSMAV